MNALQMNAEIYRNLGLIAEDENLLRRAMKYLQKLGGQVKEDPACMTKKEYFAMLDESLAQADKGEVYSFTDKQQMFDWLNSL